jgi:hypothetical protein
MRKFLEAYAATGRVAHACDIADISRETHYHKLETDSGYQQAFARAQQQLADVIEDELFRRGIAGESDALLMFLARGFMPDKYKDRSAIEHSGSIDLVERMRAADQRLIALQRNAPPTGTDSR